LIDSLFVMLQFTDGFASFFNGQDDFRHALMYTIDR
jgi:hypothetical protein